MFSSNLHVQVQKISEGGNNLECKILTFMITENIFLAEGLFILVHVSHDPYIKFIFVVKRSDFQEF